MKKMMKNLCAVCVLAAFSVVTSAKLPAPSDEAKAKADESKAKAAWVGKVGAYKLCLAQDRVVAHYKKMPDTQAMTGAAKSAAPASACADPGPFVYTPNGAAAPVAAAPAAPAAVAAKKP